MFVFLVRAQAVAGRRLSYAAPGDMAFVFCRNCNLCDARRV